MTIPLTLTLSASHENISLLAPFVSSFCDQHAVSAHDKGLLVLALEELTANVINHASLEDTGAHQIEIQLYLENNAVISLFTDDSDPFNLLSLPAPELDLPVEQRRVGGLGIHLVREIMDQVLYKRDKGCNHITLIKHLNQNETA